MIHLFEARLLSFLDHRHWWRKVRVPWFVSHYVYGLVFITPVYLSAPDQQTAQKLILQQFSCIPDYIQVNSIFVFALDTNIPMITFIFSFCSLALEIFFSTVITKFVLDQQMTKNVSRNTMRRQV